MTNVSVKSLIGKHYNEFWNFKGRYRVVKGSRASKKSKTTALWYAIWLNKQGYEDANLVVFRKTYSSLKNSCFSDLQWAFQRVGVLDQWKITTNPLEMTRKSTGQKVLFRGLDDPLKITSITVDHGYLCWAWLEEAYEVLNEATFNILDESIRGKMPEPLFKQWTITFNPWSETSWLKSKFFDHADEDPEIFCRTTNYTMNEWLDDADHRLFETMKKNNPRRYRVAGLGEWGISEGVIYDNIKLERVDIDTLRKRTKASFGLDFGFTDPTVLICALVDNDNKRIYVFDEWYKQGVTNQDIAAALVAMGYGGQVIYCDSAEPKSIEELRAAGIKAEPSRKGADSVLYGIQLLQGFEIVVDPSCTNFWKEISNYCWQTDKTGRPIDKPDHEFSHGPDALRYGVSSSILPPKFSFE